MASVQSSAYRNTNVDCILSFYIYMDSALDSNIFYPMMHHLAIGQSTELDRFTPSTLEQGAWNKVDIGLGRHRDAFQIELAVAHVADQYEAGIAVDEITFFDCAVRSPQDECMPDEFHCAVNRACVFQDQTCDYADDCGDYTDEVLEACDAYIRTNFENPDEPFGFLNQDDPDADFKWSRGNGTTINQQTGPPFDHTLFEPDGHYLFIASEQQQADEVAYLATPLFKAPAAEETCIVRFYVHLHGQGVGNLTLYSM